ncbi:MAG: transcription elongation factor subunit Spt4 [Halobacteria archaeon]|nr:transcription elongation factor subunit Spt4 [Halobacteria archaeon]
MVDKLACRDCHRVVRDAEECPECGSTSLSDDWKGYVFLIEPENSEIAEAMETEREGKYALKVR